jgi:hypothetical protein
MVLYGRKISIVRILPRRSDCMRYLSEKQRAIFKNNAYYDIGGSYTLLYKDFTESGVAKYIYDNYGVGIWLIRTWVFKGKKYRGEWKTKYQNLITIQVFELGDGRHDYNVIRKDNISRYNAWKDKVNYNLSMGMADE